MISFEPGEEIILKIRKHWFALLAEGITIMVLWTIVIVLLYVIPESVTKFIKGDFGALRFAIIGAWTMVLWIAFFVFWTNFYFDVWIITNRHLIAVNQKRLFAREVSTMRLDRVQDLNVEVAGIFQSIIKIGTIRIQSASETQEFVLSHVGEPYEIKSMIDRIVDEATDYPQGRE